MRYFISDLHFNHYNRISNQGIITFERTNFKTIEEHDNYLVRLLIELSSKLKPEDEIWNLGDFGSLDFLYIVDYFKKAGVKTYFVYGNHDSKSDLPYFEKAFDQVFLYPVYLSQRLVVSHFPVAVWPDTINVCGHLHGAKLKDLNHICASIHVANYRPITDRYLDSVYSRLPKYVRRFLYEPWANDYCFIQPKEDVVVDPSGNIDLSASRLLQKLNTERRIQEKNPYQPYHGQGDFYE